MMSQSPAGSQLDFDTTLQATIEIDGEECRNPPQGLSSISTYRGSDRHGEVSRTCRNPPQGLSSIPTTIDRRSCRERVSDVAIPRRVSARFRLEDADGLVTVLRNISQSPAGSQLDFDADPPGRTSRPRRPCRNPPQGLSSISTSIMLVLVKAGDLDVAIPRRVSARFRRAATSSGTAKPGLTCRNPPQGLSSISTRGRRVESGLSSIELVAIPRRVSARFRRVPRFFSPVSVCLRCRNPPQGLSSISSSYGNVFEVADHRDGRNPPQGLSSISTRGDGLRGSNLRHVAIPRRVSARFRPPTTSPMPHQRSCRNPPQGLSSISTGTDRFHEPRQGEHVAIPRRGSARLRLSSSNPNLCRRLRISQSPAGAQLDYDLVR